MKIQINSLVRYLTAVTIIGGLVFYSSCEKDDGPEVVMPPATVPVSFNDSIQPILTTYCAKSGCHVSGGQTPNLTAGSAYNSLMSGGYINTASPASSTVYLYLTGGKTPQMPLGGPYNPDNIESLMLTWIEQGALNN